jgi:hypothetical protein
MISRYCALLALTVLLAGATLRAEEEEAPGLKVGTDAPAVTGKVWLTADGKAPELKGKVYLLDFWFGT